ncbi:MAG: asparagine synthase (glutamine-hydrolyzing) [Vicinamibacterales bacterium]
MCGIAGFVGSSPPSQERVDRCLALMHRRGPDQQAARFFQNAAGRHACLLFARLSIIDLDERSSQPFNVGTSWLATNGELYNYRELASELPDSAGPLRTASDTEVLLRSILAHGWSALDRFEGMWAFALYDEATGSLTLCRDRFGEKPLYLYRDATGTYFGSEVKFIAALLGRRLPVDERQLRTYLVNGYKALYKSGRTFFEGVTELEPGTVLSIDAHGHEQARRYWTPSLAVTDGMTFASAVSGVRDRLFRSVEIRLRSDVPLAFCMSGGVDSNALIAIARRALGFDVHGFTIVNTDERYEEQALVETAVSELGIRHTAVPLDTRDFLPRLRELVRQHDAPVFTITYYVHWVLMQHLAAQGYRIAISGTGADELFTGYYDHHLAYLAMVRSDPALHAASLRHWATFIRPHVRNPFLSDPDLFVRDPAFRGHIYLDAEEFAGCLHDGIAEPFRERAFVTDVLRNRMLNELFYESVPVILHEDDLNAMYFSIENRSPFLDRELFEFAASVPTRHLIRGGYAKALLREAVRGVAPDAIIDSHRKVGFNAPILSLLDTADAAVRRELLADSPIFDIVRRDRIEALIDRRDLPNSRSKFLFYFASAKMFLEEYAG